MNFLISLKSNKILFLIPLILFANPAYGDDAEIQMDWLIEGQIDQKQITSNEDVLVSNYEDTIENDLDLTEKPIYKKFVTNNEYSIGDYKVTIDSEEGQILNGVIVEQQELQEESFKHKIKYFNRFSDGYVEIAEALLNPIGDTKYLINGRALDYNPNSNLELFVLERGYTMDNLEAIPNDVFTPKEFTLGREMMDEAFTSGEGEFDLREYSPNYLHLNREQIEERMMNSFREQTSQIFDDIMINDKSQRDGILSNPNIGIPNPSSNIFDNFKFEQSKFENTRHVRDSLQTNPFQIDTVEDSENMLFLLVILAVVGILGLVYLLRRNVPQKKLETPLQIIESKIDYRQFTKEMLDGSLHSFNNNQRKDAYELLSKAIRYYFSEHLRIQKEMTNFELLTLLQKSNSHEYQQVREWLLLCGSVEYAKYQSHDDDFKDALSKFSEMIS